jgi:hypothetical protein
MKDTTRSEVWSILAEAFLSIQHELENEVPSVKTQMGQNHNDDFWFRAYAGYSVPEREIVISFDVQMKANQLHVSGDIALEQGMVLKEMVDVKIQQAAKIDGSLLEIARRFALCCKDEAQLIKAALL